MAGLLDFSPLQGPRAQTPGQVISGNFDKLNDILSMMILRRQQQEQHAATIEQEQRDLDERRAYHGVLRDQAIADAKQKAAEKLQLERDKRLALFAKGKEAAMRGERDPFAGVSGGGFTVETRPGKEIPLPNEEATTGYESLPAMTQLAGQMPFMGGMPSAILNVASQKAPDNKDASLYQTSADADGIIPPPAGVMPEKINPQQEALSRFQAYTSPENLEAADRNAAARAPYDAEVAMRQGTPGEYQLMEQGEAGTTPLSEPFNLYEARRGQLSMTNTWLERELAKLAEEEKSEKTPGAQHAISDPALRQYYRDARRQAAQEMYDQVNAARASGFKNIDELEKAYADKVNKLTSEGGQNFRARTGAQAKNSVGVTINDLGEKRFKAALDRDAVSIAKDLATKNMVAEYQQVGSSLMTMDQALKSTNKDGSMDVNKGGPLRFAYTRLFHGSGVLGEHDIEVANAFKDSGLENIFGQIEQFKSGKIPANLVKRAKEAIKTYKDIVREKTAQTKGRLLQEVSGNVPGADPESIPALKQRMESYIHSVFPGDYYDENGILVRHTPVKERTAFPPSSKSPTKVTATKSTSKSGPTLKTDALPTTGTSTNPVVNDAQAYRAGLESLPSAKPKEDEFENNPQWGY